MITLHDALVNGHGTWRSFTCPIHDDRSPSARVNVVTGKWVCMVCHSKGKADKYEVPEQYVIDKVRNLDRQQRTIPDSMAELFIDSEYWLSRFSPEACREFELMFDPIKEKSLYTLRDSTDSLLGFVYRNEPGSHPKYRYPRGVSTSSLLYGLSKVNSDVVFIMEGAPDVVSMWEAGFSSVGTYGSVLYPAQIALLGRLAPRKVVVAYDMDKAGWEGSYAALRALKDMGIPAIRAAWTEEYKDAAEMPISARRRIFARFLDTGLTFG